MASISNRRRRRWSSVIVASFIAAFFISTLHILHVLTPTLTSTSFDYDHLRSLRLSLQQKPPQQTDLRLPLHRYGELLLSFLPEDLPFTIFIPSSSTMVDSMFKAMSQKSNTGAGNFSGDLKPRDNWEGDEVSVLASPESQFAVLSRIFGFSTVPRKIQSRMVPIGDELALESISGYRLYVSRQASGPLLVNNLPCSRVDMSRGAIVIHLVDGILMDSEFEQSVIPYRDDVDDDSE